MDEAAMRTLATMSEADKNAVWNTAITRVEPNKVAVRGYGIAELMGRVSFGAAVYLILTGELPSPAVARLMDAILVSSIDHGATPPSALAARTVASTGATLSASVAAGIMSINRHHGGAIEDCARQLKAIADLGMNPVAFNGIFMIARTPGLIAHVIEEQTREKPMRRIDPVKHGYDGPPPRTL